MNNLIADSRSNPGSRQDSATKESQMSLVLYKDEEEKTSEFPFSEFQAEIVMLSLFNQEKEGKTYSSEELLSSVDLDIPRSECLYSIKDAAMMLDKVKNCGAVLLININQANQEEVVLDYIQTSVIIARLGINLEMNYYVSDSKLFEIYGSEWKPEYKKVIFIHKTKLPRHAHSYKSIMEDICNPRTIKKMLDKSIIGQDIVKEKLATVIYEQEIAIRYNELHKDDPDFVPIRRKNVLLYGPSGSGKTAMLKKLATITNRPVVIFDSTTLTPAGYIGNSVDSILVQLVKKADGDLQKASYGIVFLDEWDKAFFGATGNKELGTFKGEAASFELLRMMDGCVVTFELGQETFEINTENILFILGGAFTHLDDIVLKRIAAENANSEVSIGFKPVKHTQAVKCDTEVPDATMEDLKEFGIPTELLGRISVICRFKALDRNDLVKILARSEQSPIREYAKLFDMHNISLKVSAKTLEAVADKAIEQKLGARGLTSILDNVLSPVMFKIAGEQKQQVLHLKPECITEGKTPRLVRRMR